FSPYPPARDSPVALPDALPIFAELQNRGRDPQTSPGGRREHRRLSGRPTVDRVLQRVRVVPAGDVLTRHAAGRVRLRPQPGTVVDRKSTRLNSSHVKISYAGFW